MASDKAKKRPASDPKKPEDRVDTPSKGTPITPIADTGLAAAIKHSDRIYQLMVEAVRDYAIFMLDPRGHVASWNRGAERIKGYTADEIIGQHFSVFYPRSATDIGHPQKELEIAAKVGRFEEEAIRIRKDGSQFWANVVITAVRDTDGTLIGFAKVTRDLTERRNAELRAIADARRVAEAEAANVAKTEFLAAMSHELRTPLNAIGGYTDLLSLGLGGPVTPQQAEYLERIRHSQQHLMGVITDLLNFSRIEAGHLTYDIAPISLTHVIEAIGPLVEPQAIKKGLSLTIETATTCVARGDRAKVDQILLNLLSNAVKFTAPPGSVRVLCHSSENTASIDVVDTGVGIAPDKQESIFEPFVQLGRSLSSAHEGVGLGLAISRDLARAMGGDLTVVSSAGEGSTFTLSLPREK
ncbi:MAG TPA: PAS domain-containing sensor histidine kinase [Gemmatimonadaceae bacterium]|jgi:PAS domain S-box-containing protein